MELSVVALIISALLGAGGITALVKARAENKKINADAEVTLGGGWQLLYETTRKEHREELNALRERLAVVEREEEECRRRLGKLEKLSVSDLDVESKVMELINAEIVKRGGKIDGTQAA